MNKLRYRKQVAEAHKTACQHDGFRERFVAELRDILRPQTASGFADHLNLEHDIGYLCDTARDYDFAASQLNMFVADYLEMAVEKDFLSRQDNNKKTYMRLIKN